MDKSKKVDRDSLIFRGKTKNFSEMEFRCICGCYTYNMRQPFIARLQYARTQAGIPFVIEAGSMCNEKMKQLPYADGAIPMGAEPLAAHSNGRAADISADPERLAKYGINVTGEEIFGLILPALFKAQFKHIGIYFEQKLIHVDDVNWNKNMPVIIWG